MIYGWPAVVFSWVIIIFLKNLRLGTVSKGWSNVNSQLLCQSWREFTINISGCLHSTRMYVNPESWIFGGGFTIGIFVHLENVKCESIPPWFRIHDSQFTRILGGFTVDILGVRMTRSMWSHYLRGDHRVATSVDKNCHQPSHIYLPYFSFHWLVCNLSGIHTISLILQHTGLCFCH